ncbi:MAG: glycosyltransferase family 4 protein [Actinobacteria bacterium]|nr:glycosyltransferase family 4 protein [Actinomycetota bacterium]
MTASRQNVVIDGRLLVGRDTGVGRYITQLGKEILACGARTLDIEMLCQKGDQPPDDLSGIISREKSRSGPCGRLFSPAAVRRSSCDLYHYPSFDPPYSFGKKVVVTCPDIEPLRRPDLFPRKIVVYYRMMMKRLRTATSIIAISANTATDLQACLGVDAGRIHVIPLGVDAHYMTVTDAGTLEETARRHDLPESFILYVGNTMRHKNLPCLIRAMAIIRGRHPEITLLIAGARDRYRGEVEKVIREAGQENSIRFLGHVSESDMPALYSSASVFAFPSLYEGFGLPVLESMACGTAVVASNAASIPEVVGDAGILVDAASDNEMAEAIMLLLEDRAAAAELSERGIERARKFTWEKCAQRHLEVYRDALELS